jgi:hypothetical protein
MGRFASVIGLRLGKVNYWDYKTCIPIKRQKNVLVAEQYVAYIKYWFLLNIARKEGIMLSHVTVIENVDNVDIKIYVYNGRLFDDHYALNRRRRRYLNVNFLSYFLRLREDRVIRSLGIILKYQSELYWRKKVNLFYYSLYKNEVTAKFLINFLKIQLKRGFSVPELMKYMRKKFMRHNNIIGYRIDFGGRFRRKERAEYKRISGGRLPTSSIMQHIDYWFDAVILKYGACSIKVWLYRKKPINKYLYKIKL